MSNQISPKNGDFATYVSDLSKAAESTEVPSMLQELNGTVEELSLMQRVQEMLNKGEPLSEEILRELDEMEELPPISEDELERQALADPGADGDPNTPE